MSKTRGVFERPEGSGIWWILYYVKGVRHREKVGRKSDAKDLYQKRKADARAGSKLPQLRARATLLKELVSDAIEFAESHRKDVRNYRSRGRYVTEGLGARNAEELTPQEITRWLERECSSSPALFNRYKSFISSCYRIGLSNKKVTHNPARQIPQKRESSGRIRFLSRDEAADLERVLASDYPEHLDTFLVSLHTGMRLSEQFHLEWSLIDFERKHIDLRKTKNSYPRIIPLNSIALAAFERQSPIIRESKRIFRHSSAGVIADVRPWFPEALEKAGIEGFTWHGNRHTFCSWMVMAGVPLKVVQEIAGHKTIAMTARYAHLAPEFKASEVERMVVPINVKKPAKSAGNSIKIRTSSS